jgi:hypothetical protein
MVKENKLEAAEKAEKEHRRNILKVKQSIKEIVEEGSIEEINKPKTSEECCYIKYEEWSTCYSWGFQIWSCITTNSCTVNETPET